MERRNFLIGGIAASAAVRAWPFRVYSFPSQIIIVDYLAEKEKYIRLARSYIDEQVAKHQPDDFVLVAPLKGLELDAQSVIEKAWKSLKLPHFTVNTLPAGKPLLSHVIRVPKTCPKG